MTTQIAASACFVAPAQTLKPRADIVTSSRSSLQVISVWWRRFRERRQLTTLSNRDLADFMCSTADARAEASKWFWEA